MASKSTAVTQTINKDLRTDFAGATGGQIAAPGSTIASPGAVGMTAGDYSSIALNVSGGFKSGMTGAEVKEILGQQASIAKETVTKVADFAGSSIAATMAAKTGELPNWQRYIPYLAGGAVLLVIVLKARR